MIAYLFPGQGSHEIGMGKAVFEKYPEAAELFHRADEILGFKFSTLCFEGPLDQLTDTSNQQPALFVTGLATLAAMRANEAAAFPPADFYAGHSLGELTALVAADVLSFEDGLRLVRKRGELMKAAGEQNPGSMAAFLGFSVEQSAEVCTTASAAVSGTVQIANDNCPGQIVISGDNDAVEHAMGLAEAGGAKKVVKLPITIAAHSSLMGPAGEAFAKAVTEIPLQPPSTPVIGNTTAGPITTVAEIRAELNAQLTQAVRWTESMQYLLTQGVDTVYEVGPKDVLLSLMKRINRKVKRETVAF